MNGVGGGGDAEEGRAEVEGHAVDGGRIRAPAELVELLAAGHGEDADDSASDAGGGEESAIAVESHAAEWCSVSFDDILGLEGEAVEDDELARRGRDELRLWRGMGRFPTRGRRG